MRAVQLGDYREAASALQQALQIAPTYAAAHDYLGRLQLEAGRPEQGVRHIELALELDPTLVWCLRDMARYHALRGNREQCEHWWRRLEKSSATNDLLRAQELRFATYFGDREWIRRVAEGHWWSELTRGIVSIYTGDLDAQALSELMERVLVLTGSNPRIRTVRLQSFSEGAAWQGHDEIALRCLVEAADEVLVDLDWMDRCPLLDRLRTTEAFAKARERVAARASAIWAV
jgi:serine/threonine-protein kinase